jgi:hypothetical protein
MEINKKPWPLLTVCSLKARIDPQPDYQRPAVWSLGQKQLLIDTILRGYDVPKFYWRKVSTGPDKYEVIDGQQRLRTIWDFQAGGFPLPKDADAVSGHKVAGLRYEDLPDDLRIVFDTYTLDVVIVDNSDEDEVREMFLRLQNGTTLKAQEKRNAMPGAMRGFIKDLAEHPIFASCNFANSRFTHDLIAAQMTLLELEGGPTNVKNADLNRMYRDQAEFNSTGPKAAKIRRGLAFLKEMFPSKTPELERYSAVSLYLVVSHLLERYVVNDRQKALAEWFIDFEEYRRGQRLLPIDECDPEIALYHEKTSHSTDGADSLQWRHDYLMRQVLERFSDIRLKDDQRIFTHDQRIAIFRRDKSICQLRLKCDGTKCEWDHWEADHKEPWSKGGRTTVANGQVACPACNLAKSDTLAAAE